MNNGDLATQQVRVQLSEEDFVKCPGCSGMIFNQAYRVAMIKTAVIGEHQTVLVNLLYCRDCGREFNPKDIGT